MTLLSKGDVIYVHFIYGTSTIDDLRVLRVNGKTHRLAPVMLSLLSTVGASTDRFWENFDCAEQETLAQHDWYPFDIEKHLSCLPKDAAEFLIEKLI